MPENDNARRPLESIRDWRNRIRDRIKYGKHETLEPAMIIADRPEQKPRGNWISRIRQFRNPYGTRRDVKKAYNIEKESLQQRVSDPNIASDPEAMERLYFDIIRFQPLEDRLAYHDRRTDEYRGNYASSLFPWKRNSDPTDKTSQYWRWYSRHHGFEHKAQESNEGSFSDKGTDIIDLSHNTIRMGPNTEQANGLFNEYVESELPSVWPASEYQNGNVKIFGDQYRIPVENISLYAGLENGGYKVDSLKNFNPETIIYPARNIRRGQHRIRSLVIDNLENRNNKDSKELLETFTKNFNNYRSTNYQNMTPEQSAIYDNFGKKLSSAMWDFNRPKRYGYISAEDGQYYPITDWQASILDNKIVLGSPTSSIFVGRIQDISKPQLDSLNAWSAIHHPWMVRPDLGSGALYNTNYPTTQEYLSQFNEHPVATDPNVFAVGTTTPNFLWKNK